MPLLRSYVDVHYNGDEESTQDLSESVVSDSFSLHISKNELCIVFVMMLGVNSGSPSLFTSQDDPIFTCYHLMRDINIHYSADTTITYIYLCGCY